MTDTDLLNLIESGSLGPDNFRRCPDGQWEYFHTADGPPGNRWIRFPGLRQCLEGLKANNDTIAAAKAAAETAPKPKPAANK